MNLKVFRDKIFPRQVSDLMNLMHMVIYQGTDGEESWQTWLTPTQKEYISLGLAEYYQCDHCIEHHMAALCRLEPLNKSILSRNVNSMILFLRIDTRSIGEAEQRHWIDAWQRFARALSSESGDAAMPYLMGLGIGIARDDEFLMRFCGEEVKRILGEQGQDFRSALGELEAVVVFMKAATGKNRVADKINTLCD